MRLLPTFVACFAAVCSAVDGASSNGTAMATAEGAATTSCFEGEVPAGYTVHCNAKFKTAADKLLGRKKKTVQKCAALCDKRAECVSFTFKSSNGQCSLMSSSLYESSGELSGFTSFEKNSFVAPGERATLEAPEAPEAPSEPQYIEVVETAFFSRNPTVTINYATTNFAATNVQVKLKLGTSLVGASVRALTKASGTEVVPITMKRDLEPGTEYQLQVLFFAASQAPKLKQAFPSVVQSYRHGPVILQQEELEADPTCAAHFEYFNRVNEGLSVCSLTESRSFAVNFPGRSAGQTCADYLGSAGATQLSVWQGWVESQIAAEAVGYRNVDDSRFNNATYRPMVRGTGPNYSGLPSYAEAPDSASSGSCTVYMAVSFPLASNSLAVQELQLNAEEFFGNQGTSTTTSTNYDTGTTFCASDNALTCCEAGYGSSDGTTCTACDATAIPPEYNDGETLQTATDGCNTQTTCPFATTYYPTMSSTVNAAAACDSANPTTTECHCALLTACSAVGLLLFETHEDGKDYVCCSTSTISTDTNYCSTRYRAGCLSTEFSTDLASFETEWIANPTDCTTLASACTPEDTKWWSNFAATVDVVVWSTANSAAETASVRIADRECSTRTCADGNYATNYALFDGITSSTVTESIATTDYACTAWKDACAFVASGDGSGEYESAAGTATSDRVCQPVSVMCDGTTTCDTSTCCDAPATCDSFSGASPGVDSCADSSLNKGSSVSCTGDATTCDTSTCCDAPATCDEFIGTEPGVDSCVDTSLNRGSGTSCVGDAGTCDIATCCKDPFVVVRPFFDGDAGDLAASFARWANTDYAPCALDEITNNPTNAGLPVNMILYYSRDATSSEGAAAIAELDGIVTNNDNAAWRHCFTSISIVSAELSDAEDQYHSDQTDPTWNLGPNLQFYKLLEYMSSYSATDRFYYMEGDSIPVAQNWLDALADEVSIKQPFSVLGSRYSGHNWDKLTSVSDYLKYHLNGNAVYDTTHDVVSSALSNYQNLADFKTTAQPSFDVCIAKMLVDPVASGGFAIVEADLETDTRSQYKVTSLLKNFATTLTLPQDIDTDAVNGVKIVHGAVYLQNWPSPKCPRQLNPTWYPTTDVLTGTHETLTLVVSDFDSVGDHASFLDFYESLSTAADNAKAASEIDDPDCTDTFGHPLEALPFSKIVVVTTDQAAADSYTAVFDFMETMAGFPNPVTAFMDGSSFTFVVRDEKEGGAWWDLCDTTITTDWFMMVTTDFTVEQQFTLPVDVESDGTLAPIIPFLNHESQYCDRACKASIVDARTTNAAYNKNVDQEYAVFKATTKTDYCASTYVDSTSSPAVPPSINGYFAFVQDPPATSSTTCPSVDGAADSPLCGQSYLSDQCDQPTLMGNYVRSGGVCAVACNSCEVTLADDAVAPTEERDEKPNFDWWERKTATDYQMYNRDKLYTAFGMVGKVDTSARCEDNSEVPPVFTDCPCKFPFFMYDEATDDIIEYTECTDKIPDTIPGQYSCPTALTDTNEFHIKSNDWRHCTSTNNDPIPTSGRRRRSLKYEPRLSRRDDNVTAPVNNAVTVALPLNTSVILDDLNDDQLEDLKDDLLQWYVEQAEIDPADVAYVELYQNGILVWKNGVRVDAERHRRDDSIEAKIVFTDDAVAANANIAEEASSTIQDKIADPAADTSFSTTIAGVNNGNPFGFTEPSSVAGALVTVDTTSTPEPTTTPTCNGQADSESLCDDIMLCTMAKWRNRCPVLCNSCPVERKSSSKSSSLVAAASPFAMLLSLLAAYLA